MQKSARHKKIISLVSEFRIKRQDELAQRLTAAGFEVTQASISRDLEELGISKTDGVYSIPRPASAAAFLGPIELRPSGETLLVARCASGLASAAAVRIDAAELDGIVGTIAGDDTIFIAVRDAKARTSVARSLGNIFSR